MILENIYNKSTSSSGYLWKQTLLVIVFRDLSINVLIARLCLRSNGGSQMCWMLCFKASQQCRALCFVTARGQRDLMLRQTLTTAQGPARPRPRGNSQCATLHSSCGMIPFPLGSRLHFFTPTQKNNENLQPSISYANIKDEEKGMRPVIHPS